MARVKLTRHFGDERYTLDKKFKFKHDADYRAWTQRQIGFRARVVKTKDGYAIFTRR